jgi:hypothetical protein
MKRMIRNQTIPDNNQAKDRLAYTDFHRKVADAYCRQYQPSKGFTKAFYYLVSPERSDSDTITMGDRTVYDHTEYPLSNFIMIMCQ